MWVLSPVFLLLGFVLYMNFALGSALGPVDEKFLFFPFAFAIITGLLAVGAYLQCPPRSQVFRVTVLCCYTIPVVLLAAYTVYASAHLGYFFTKKAEINEFSFFINRYCLLTQGDLEG